MAVTGYTRPTNPADPTYAKGYRSWRLARKDTGQLLVGSDVSYNGYIFPPFLEADATVVQEYDSSNRTVKQLLIVLTIKFLITPYDTSGSVGANPTVDNEMMDVRERLSQNGQQLSFTLQGFGDFYIQDFPQSYLALVAGSSGSPRIVYDVDFGPKAQVTAWTPVAGGAAVEVEWLVTTRIPACSSGGSVNGLTGLLEFNYATSWGIDPGGFMTRSVSGHVEVAAGRRASSSSIHSNNLQDLNKSIGQWDKAVATLRQTFPEVGGWKRTESFSVTENKKTLNFSFNDVEIPSPSPIPKGILDINLHESLKSTIDEGFNLWNWNFSGDISVLHSKTGPHDIVSNKRMAFNFLYLILRDRLDRVSRTVRYKLRPGERPTAGTPVERVAWTYPTIIEIDNELYGPGYSVNFGFILSVPPVYLFQVSGMLDAVRIPGVTWDQMRDFAVSSGTRVPYLDVLPGYEGIVDLCHPLTAQPLPATSPRRNPQPQTNNLLIVSEVPSEEQSWIDYQNEFGVDVEHPTTAVPLLSPDATPVNVRVEDAEANPRRSSGARAWLDLIFPAAGAAYDAYNLLGSVDLQSGTQPRVIITMRGRAARIGYPVNPPDLISVGGAPVVRVGRDQVRSRRIASGFTKSGEATSIYLLSWQRSYLLTGPPTVQAVNDRWDMRSTGHPELYA